MLAIALGISLGYLSGFLYPHGASFHATTQRLIGIACAVLGYIVATLVRVIGHEASMKPNPDISKACFPRRASLWDFKRRVLIILAMQAVRIGTGFPRASFRIVSKPDASAPTTRVLLTGF